MQLGVALLCVLSVGGLAAGCKGSKPPLGFAPPELPAGVVGAPYRAEISVTGEETPVGEVSVASGQLPPGLALKFTRDAEVSVIDGTPTGAGTYSFTLRAWSFGTNEPGQGGSKPYRIVIGPR